MLDYIYQLQKRSHGRWVPCITYKNSHPYESTDLQSLRDSAQFLSSKYQCDLRIIKTETYLIDTISEY